MSKKLGILKFRPPVPSAGLPVLATVSLASKPLDLPAALNTEDQLATEITLKKSDSFGFCIMANEGICALTVLPLGWPGGCDPRIQLHLGDTGAETMKEYGLDPGTDVVEPCRVVRCTYDGNGILTCRTSGTSLTVDLTTSVYADGGAYLALHTDGAVANSAKIIFNDSRLKMQEF